MDRVDGGQEPATANAEVVVCTMRPPAPSVAVTRRSNVDPASAVVVFSVARYLPPPSAPTGSLVQAPPGRRISTRPEVIAVAGAPWMCATASVIDDVPSGTLPTRLVGSATAVRNSGSTAHPDPSEQVQVGGGDPPWPAAETKLISVRVVNDCRANDGRRSTSSRIRYVPDAAGTATWAKPVSLLSEISAPLR